jgi:hypothetical protein
VPTLVLTLGLAAARTLVPMPIQILARTPVPARTRMPPLV